jgi:hypothetical protein
MIPTQLLLVIIAAPFAVGTPASSYLRHRDASSRCQLSCADEVTRHTSPEMTMRYLDVALTDLQREFQLARSRPRHLVPQPKGPSTRLRAGLDGVIDALLAAQHVLEMFRRALPHGRSRSCLDRLSTRLTKIVSEARKLSTP